MKRNLILSLVCAAAVITACGDNSTKDAGTEDTSSTAPMSGNDNSSTMDTANATGMMSNVSEADKEFAMKAASGGLFEVAAANMAMQNATSERVKKYASMMIADHGKANTELKTIAANKNITLPTAPMPEHQEHLDMLRGKKGKEFDKSYIDHMVSDHQKTVDLFEKETNGDDADLKGFASKTLPVIKAHTDSAKAISKAKM